MAGKKWERSVEREYLDADKEFVETVLPIGDVDGSSFGLISDATEYVIVKTKGENHIQPQVSSLDSILKSLKRGGKRVSKKDALEGVRKFAQVWEEKIRASGKWDQTVNLAEEEGEIKDKSEIRKGGLLGRICKLFGKK